MTTVTTKPDAVPTTAARVTRSDRWTRRDTCIVAALIALAATLRVIGISHAYDAFVDEFFYMGLGSSVRHGHLLPQVPPGWGRSSGQTFLIHPPGFFILLALWQTLTGTGGDLFHQLYTARVLNAVLAALTVGMLYALGRRLAGRWAGVIVAVLITIDPYALRQNGRLFLETATLFWVVAGYFVLVGVAQGRYRRPRVAAAAAGVLFGCAILTKDMVSIETFGALLVLAALGWGIPRRLAAISALAAACTYLIYVIGCATQGLLGDLWNVKTFNIQRLVGIIDISGFNKAGSTSLGGSLLAQASTYITSYLLIGFGTIGAVALLRSRRDDYRVLGVFVATAAALLGYAVLFGTIEDNFLYFLSIPAALSAVVIARDLARKVERRGVGHANVRAAMILVLGPLCIWNVAVWVHTRTTPDNAAQRAVDWLDVHVSKTTAVAYMTTTIAHGISSVGLRGVPLGFPSRMADDGVGFVVLANRIADLGYSFVSPAAGAWYRMHGRLVYSFTSPSEGTLGIYEAVDRRLW